MTKNMGKVYVCAQPVLGRAASPPQAQSLALLAQGSAPRLSRASSQSCHYRFSSCFAFFMIAQIECLPALVICHVSFLGSACSALYSSALLSLLRSSPGS